MSDFEVVLNGPFQTGIDLDIRDIGHAGQTRERKAFSHLYFDLQQSAFTSLSRHGCHGWAAPTVQSRAEIDFDTDDFAGVTISPHYFLHCDVHLASQEIVVLSRTNPERRYRLKAASITVHDFRIGIASMRFSADHAVKDLTDLRHDIEGLNSAFAKIALNLIRPKLAELKDCLKRLMADPEIPVNDRHVLFYDLPALKIMWLHRLYIVTGGSPESVRPEELVDQLLMRHHAAPLTDKSIDPAWSYYPSIGSSLAVCRSPRFCAQDNKLESIISLHNAYNAAIWVLDSELFDQLQDLRREQIKLSQNKAKLLEIEEHAARIFRASSQISGFLAIFKNRISRLAPQEVILAEGISEAWRLEFQVDALDIKLATLKEMYQITIKMVADSEARFMNKILLTFTVISFITFATAVIDFVVKDEAFEMNPMRLQLMLSVSAVVIAFGCWALVKQFGWARPLVLLASRLFNRK